MKQSRKKEDLRLQREKELEEKAKEEEAIRAVVVAKTAVSDLNKLGKLILMVINLN